MAKRPANNKRTGTKELVFRYLSMDESLRPIELRAKIRSQHGRLLTDSAATVYRRQYFQSVGKEVPRLKGGWMARKKQEAKVGEKQLPVKSLFKFLDVVVEVGGPLVARRLLDIYHLED